MLLVKLTALIKLVPFCRSQGFFELGCLGPEELKRGNGTGHFLPGPEANMMLLQNKNASSCGEIFATYVALGRSSFGGAPVSGILD